MKSVLNKDMLYRLFYSLLIGFLGASIGIGIGLPIEWILSGLFDTEIDVKPFAYICFGAGFTLMFVTHNSSNN